jgi:hypothetical protein
MGTKTTRLAERPTFGIPRQTGASTGGGAARAPQRGGRGGRSAALMNALNTHEPTIALLAHERAIAFDRRSGAVIFQQEGHAARGRAAAEGTVHSVAFSRAQRAQLAGTVLTHNHPVSNSFSPEDVKFAATFQVAEMRVVTSSARYSLFPPRNQAWDAAFYRTRVSPALRRAKATVQRNLQDAVDRETMTLDQANATHWHDIWVHVAEATGMLYRREAWTP